MTSTSLKNPLAPASTDSKAAPATSTKRAPAAPASKSGASKGKGVSSATSAKFLSAMMLAASKDATSEDDRIAKAAGVMKNFSVGKRLINWARTAKHRRADIHTNFELTTEEESMQGALPVREMVQVMYTIKRDRTVWDAIIFSLYTIIFIAIIGQLYDVNMANNTNNAIMDLLLDEEFPGAQYKKNFFEIMTMEEFWTWLRGPVVNGLYPNEWYNGDQYTESEQGYVLRYLRLVGGVQLRQARVDDNSCTERRYTDQVLADPVTGSDLPRFDTKDGTCFSEFSVDRQDTRPFGPPSDPTRYTWTDNWHDLDGLWGWGAAYGNGGYSTILSLNRTQAIDKVTQMFEDRWVNSGTRAVMLMFNVYNTNTRMMTVVRILVEFMHSSFVLKSFKFFSLQMIIYESVTDQMRAVGEVMFFCMYLYYVQRVVREMIAWNPWWAYPFQFRHAFEILRLVLTTTLFVNYFSFVASDVRTTFTVNEREFHDNYNFAAAYINTFTLAGLIGVLHALKFFEYLALQKRMNTLWITLGRAGFDLAAFVVGLVVLVTGFAFMGMLIFGFLLPEFHNFASSFSTLLRYPLGDFDYSALLRARPAITSVFFSLYVAIVFLVCMNMIIAIITKYYEEVQLHLDQADKWKLAVLSFEAYMYMRCSSRVRNCCRPCVNAQRRKKAMKRIATGESTDGSFNMQVDNPVANKRPGMAAVPPPSAGSPPPSAMTLLEKELRQEEESDARQEATWKAEARFTAAMTAVMHTAKKERSLDLYAYLDRLMEDTHSDHMYIAVKELRYLVLKKPNNTRPVKDVVLQLYTSYRKWKSVTIVGDAVRHMPVMAFRLTNERLLRYNVIKVNTKNAVKHERIMVVDPYECLLMNFDKNMRLKKKLPLIQLLQIETMTADPLRVNLVFSSEGAHGTVRRTEVIDKLLEVTYGLYFRNEEQRDSMVRDILAAQSNFERVLDMSVGRGSSSKSKVLKRRNSIITKLHRFKATSKYEQLLKTGQLAGHGLAAAGAGAGKGAAGETKNAMVQAVNEATSAMFRAVTKQSIAVKQMQAQLDELALRISSSRR